MKLSKIEGMLVESFFLSFTAEMCADIISWEIYAIWWCAAYVKFRLTRKQQIILMLPAIRLKKMFRQISPDSIPIHNRIDFLLIIEMSLFIIQFYEMGENILFCLAFEFWFVERQNTSVMFKSKYFFVRLLMQL